MDSGTRGDAARRCGPPDDSVWRRRQPRNVRRAELGKAIAANPGDFEAALLAYEKDLFLRSASEAADAKGVLNVYLGPNMPQSLLDFFTSHQPAK
jgi:hypothetical protein